VSLGLGIAQDSGGDAGAVGSAVTKTSTIGIGDIDVYTITANTGGSLLASVAETVAGSPLSPLIELYNPSGGLLTFASSATGTTVTSRSLPANGTYFLTVRDSTGAGTGAYAMTPVSLGSGIAQNSGGDAGAVGSALTKTASLGAGDI